MSNAELFLAGTMILLVVLAYTALFFIWRQRKRERKEAEQQGR